MSDIGIVFPGQGAQSLGMLAELGEARARIRETFEEASDALGLDLWRLAQEGPEEDLNRTENTQPVLLAAGVAVYRVWRDEGGPRGVAMAGHSLGEYSALVAAGAMDLGDAASLVAERGRLMQQAVPEGSGAMAAILGLDDDTVRGLCAQAAGDEVVEAVNFNAPGQVVVAGHKAAVDRVAAAAREAGAKRVVPLAVSAPSHCALMRPAAERLAERLAEVPIRTPEVPVIHNADVAAYEDPERIRDALVRQLHSPVRWVETVRKLHVDGVDTLIEAGPGKVLTGLNRRIERAVTTLPVFDLKTLEAALAAMEETAHG